MWTHPGGWAAKDLLALWLKLLCDPLRELYGGHEARADQRVARLLIGEAKRKDSRVAPFPPHKVKPLAILPSIPSQPVFLRLVTCMIESLEQIDGDLKIDENAWVEDDPL